jgi:MFS family permease
MYGYDQGVMSSILVMENFQAQFPSLMGDTIQGWLVAALELGAWAGALLCGWLADVISRRYSMMVAVIVFTLGTCLQCAAHNPGMLFAGRIIGGVGIGMFSMVIPMYQAEIAPPELRGGLVSLQQLSITIGMCKSHGHYHSLGTRLLTLGLVRYLRRFLVGLRHAFRRRD